MYVLSFNTHDNDLGPRFDISMGLEEELNE